VIDALGEPQTVALVGGTSEIGLAIVHRLARSGRLRRVVLAGRKGPGLDEAVGSLVAAGVEDVTTVPFDARVVEEHGEAVDAMVSALGEIDVAVVAVGVLGDQAAYEEDPAAAADAGVVNYVGPMSVCLHLAGRLRRQGHGALVVLSSVAGDRPRRSNFVYGSSKAGLDALATGLGDALRGSGAHVMVVRPGFVRTRMTVGLDEAPLSTDPDAVADAVAKGLRRRTELVYVPSALRLVMAVLRHLPRAVFRRLPV
jgi:decaprenylphospho-beta-D-erythro-pentofuranosid-2-ulose 2-reductase